MPSDTEIDEQLNRARDQEEQGDSRWPGMSYEQGVAAAIMWLRDETDEVPIEDE